MQSKMSRQKVASINIRRRYRGIRRLGFLTAMIQGKR
jgi:hypothetical protein